IQLLTGEGPRGAIEEKLSVPSLRDHEAPFRAKCPLGRIVVDRNPRFGRLIDARGFFRDPVGAYAENSFWELVCCRGLELERCRLTFPAHAKFPVERHVNVNAKTIAGTNVLYERDSLRPPSACHP